MTEAVQGLAEIEAEPPDALAVAISRHDASRLHLALAGLPAGQRQAVVLAYGAGLSHAEVAERTGAALGTVKSRIRLAQRSLADRMEPGRRPATARAA